MTRADRPNAWGDVRHRPASHLPQHLAIRSASRLANAPGQLPQPDRGHLQLALVTHAPPVPRPPPAPAAAALRMSAQGSAGPRPPVRWVRSRGIRRSFSQSATTTEVPSTRWERGQDPPGTGPDLPYPSGPDGIGPPRTDPDLTGEPPRVRRQGDMRPFARTQAIIWCQWRAAGSAPGDVPQRLRDGAHGTTSGRVPATTLTTH